MPTFQGGGTHVNLSGVVLAKHAPNKANAIKLMECMVRRQGAAHLRRHELRIPGQAGIKLDETIASFGTLKPDTLPLAEIAKHKKAASQLVDKVGFDN